MPERAFNLLFTAEHASCTIPAAHRDVARRAGCELQTHRGYDPGTADLARRLARFFKAPLIVGRYSRLLIELNRSPHHPRLWSEFSKLLPAARKEEILVNYYQPYRDSVLAQIRRLLSVGAPVLHISVHSFTPELDGDIRDVDIGLLYDPSRKAEAAFCVRWKKVLSGMSDALRVRRNHPYRGISDGLVTHLRRQFGIRAYAGIELEVNQAFPLGPLREWHDLQTCLLRSLAETLEAGSAYQVPVKAKG